MGGRGAGSGMTGSKTTGLTVTRDGKTTQYYFTESNGKNLYRRSLSEVPRPVPGNMSQRDFAKKAQLNGAVVKEIAGREIKKAMKARAKERASRPDYEMGLSTGFGNKDNRKAARTSRLVSKAGKRK